MNLANWDWDWDYLCAAACVRPHATHSSYVGVGGT